MTPYQRGNRDACLSLAEAFCRLAETEKVNLKKLVKTMNASTNQVQLNAANKLLPSIGSRLTTYQNAERMARSAADALPDDPEMP